MKNSYYAIITANVRYDKRLTPNAKLMYGEITALTNHKGYAWASNSYFANLYEVNNKTVSRWINQLVKYEYIKTNLIYKKGTKQVEQRQIFINDTPMDNIVEGYGQESLEGMDNIVDSPMDKKVKDSTTSTNTTLNTTSNKDPFSKERKIFEYYISKGIIIHKTFTNKMKQAVRRAFNNYEYTEQEIMRAIDNYSIVYKSGEYYFNTKYDLIDMMREKDLRQFQDEKEPLNNFRIHTYSKADEEQSEIDRIRKGLTSGQEADVKHIRSNQHQLPEL